MKSGIYIIRNSINHRVYVGSAVLLSKRERAHINALLSQSHHNKPLQAFVNKYGCDCLSFSVLEYCDQDRLIEREQYWIDYYQCYNYLSGFNVRPTAGSNKGFRFSEESKMKMSAAQKSRVRTQDEIDKSRIARTGLIRTEEQKKKCSEGAKKRPIIYGRPVSEETRKKHAANSTGRKFSEESRKKMSESGKKRCALAKAMLSAE